MSALKNYKFVSPGVKVQEIDNSFINQTPVEVGPVIIGRSTRGPVMRPVRVETFSDFVEIFGEPEPGNVGGDFWRFNNIAAPTYGAYAAQAYLRNSSPVTFIRLAGTEHPERQEAGRAGWYTQNAYGLFVAPTNTLKTQIVDNSEARLAAIIYASGSSYGLSGTDLGNTSQSTSLGTWIRAEGSNLEFKIVVNGTPLTINFDDTSKKYIRSVLNTNPTSMNNKIVTSTKDYFLGETFKTFIDEKYSISSDKFAGVLVKLKDFNDHRGPAEAAETGWIISQHKGIHTSFTGSGASNEWPVQKLFKLVSLTEGSWNNKNLKIVIEDIAEPVNSYTKFGTFSIGIRKIDDNDLSPQYLERFTGLTFDKTSPNYIKQRIGDKYTEWSTEKNAFIESGMYDNKSKFIRVLMDADFENSPEDSDYLPYGFYAPVTQQKISQMGSTLSATNFIQTNISAATVVTCSYALPTIPMLTTYADSPSRSFQSTYFGFKTNKGSSKRYNEDVVDYVRDQGYTSEYNSFVFSLDDISGSVSNNSLNTIVAPTWVTGSRASKASLTANNYTSLLLSNFNRFIVPLVGGSDGVDIKERDPFNRRVLSSGNDTTNYAFNSVKRAIEALSDREVVEMNLAAMPGIENETLTDLLIEKCESRADALAVIDITGDYIPEEGKDTATMSAKSRLPDVDTAVENMSNRNIDSSYGCAFYPWVLVRDNLNNGTVWVPPSVVALGTFSSSQRASELWFAPAGFSRGGLSDGAGGLPVLQAAVKLNSKNRDQLYNVNINPIASFPSEGIVVFGQKTLQAKPSALDRINVRRLMIYLKREIEKMALSGNVLFEQNVEVTWKNFTNMVTPFLDDVKARFGITNYRLILDNTTTTQEMIDRNIMYAQVILQPARTIEFIALDFVVSRDGTSFLE